MYSRKKTSNFLYFFAVAFLIVIACSILNMATGTILNSPSFDLSTIGFNDIFGSHFFFLNYFFGKIPGWLSTLLGDEMIAVSLTLLMFYMVIITFKSLAHEINSISKKTSWLIGIAMTILFANLNGIGALLYIFIGNLSWLGGGYAAIIGVSLALFTFILIEIAFKKIASFILRNKAPVTGP